MTTHFVDPVSGVTTLYPVDPWPTQEMVEVVIDPALGLIVDKAMLDAFHNPNLQHLDAFCSTLFVLVRTNIEAGEKELALGCLDALEARLAEFVAELMSRGQG